jgi:hypothetical protein
MTVRATLLALALGVAPVCGEWTLSSSDVLATPSRGLTIREARVADGPRQATLTAILFSEKSHALRVIDSPDPGRTRMSDVFPPLGIVAGVNGGYFHDDLRPVGLVVTGGQQIHGFEKAKLLSGILTVRPGKIEIVRSSQFQSGKNLREALQCGPMLVDDGQPAIGLNAERTARRTVVTTDGRGRWALIYLTSVSLADTANILLIPGIFGDWTPVTALNLDGGGSSGLWANAEPMPISRPEFSHVRNYLGVVPK